jgi:hypothetical protein
MSEGISEEQLAEIRTHNGQYGLGDATDIIGELLAEVERLRGNAEADWRGITTALDGWNEEAGNAWRSYAEQLARAAKAERELRKCTGLNLGLVNENADLTTRAETAERELAEMRRLYGPARAELELLRARLGVGVVPTVQIEAGDAEREAGGGE